MASTIKLKNGSGAPTAGDLVQGEPALDLTNKRLYTEDSVGTVIEVGINPSVLTVTGDLTVDTNTFYVDSTNNRVGIGTSAPTAKLTATGVTGTVLVQALGVDTDGFADVEIKSTGTAGASRLYFSDTAAQSGLIRYSHNTNSMEFSTGASTRMTIDSSGNVGIGTSSPSSFNAAGTGIANAFGTGAGASTLALYSSTATSGYLYFADGTTGTDRYRGYLEYAHSDDSLRIGTGATERLRILSSGGITFNGDTAAANALDDYEEGTWTPVSATGGSPSSQLGYYVKIGRSVTATLYLQFNGAHSAANLDISGLPFTSAASNYTCAPVELDLTTNSDKAFARLNPSSATLQVAYRNSGGGYVAIDNTHLATNSYVICTITYQV